MRGVYSIFLSLVLICPFVGAYMWYAGHLAMLRMEVRQQIRLERLTADLTRLDFSHADADRLLDWEHSREFAYLGEMYDVVRSTSTRDSVTYWCHHDVKETRLRASMQAFLASQAHKPKGTASGPVQRLQQYVSHLFCSRLPAAWPDISRVPLRAVFAEPHHIPASPWPQPLVPPPRVFLT